METPMKFDPMTGQPISESGNQMSGGNNKNTGKLVGIIIGIVAVIIAIIAVVAYMILDNGLLKVSTAISNTAKEYQEKNILLNTIDVSDIVEDKEYTIDMVIETEVPLVGDVSVTAKTAVANEVIDINGNVDLSYIPAVEYQMQLTDSELKAKTPLLDDYLFVYNYTENNTGYLTQSFDAAAVNSYLSGIYEMTYSTGINDEANKEAKEALISEIKKLKFSKTKKTECVIDGKNVNCNGYMVSLSTEDINNILDKVNALVDEGYKNTLRQSGLDVENYNDIELEDDTLDITFYVYKNELARIDMSSGDEAGASVCFLGGDYRAQNIKILDNGNESAAITGNITNGIETVAIEANGQKLFGYVFDTNKDELTLSAYTNNDYYNLSMEIERDKSGLNIDLDYLDLGEYYVGGSIKLTDGATTSELSGSEFNIGTASESEVNELVSSIYSIVLGLMGW